MRYAVLVGLFLISSLVWAQAPENADPAKVGEDRMLAPPPVSGQAYAVALDSEEHANSLHYGLTFSTGYSDNVLGAVNGHSVSDVNYSIWPTIGLDASTTRLHWDLNYAPGFTFYQHTSGRNEADQSASIGFQYRLSPHVTFSAQDNFQKSSSVFNQPSIMGPVFGGGQGPNNSVVAPLADRLSNFGTVTITYQYARNDMIGAGGSFYNLHYPDLTQVTGLSDAASQSGSGFYTHRFSASHYVGVSYAYQRLMSYPSGMDYRTLTHSVFLFYTVYPSRRVSMSFFGGPQFSDTVQPGIPSLHFPAFSSRAWNPQVGASVNWQRRFVSTAFSYSHAVSSGGGLVGASRLDNATGGLRLQFTPSLTASLSGLYANNNVIGNSLGAYSGHTYSGSAALERRIGERVGVQIGYTRLHQNYQVPVLAGTPDTNREFISLSYSLARPLGR